MNILVQSILLSLLVSCSNTNQQMNDASHSDSLIEQGKFCNSSIGYNDSTQTMEIVIDIDTVNNLKSMSEYFECVKQHLLKKDFLREKFIRDSKYIYLTFSSYGNIKMTDVNYELINYADTSMFWTEAMFGRGKSSNEIFFDFITNSGYAKKWEQVLSEILGKEYKWKYGAENIFYISGAELSKRLGKQYKKELYPCSFELYLMRQ